MNKMNKMNKMNRFLVALLVAIIFGGSFVSCIDSEVSPEIKKIYQGQADLLASQVTVNQAEATLKAAEAALKGAEAILKKAEADLRAADAEVQKAHAARITSETSSNATAAEVAAEKARAEVARILAETIIAVAKAEAAAARASFELKQAQELHIDALKAEGFKRAEGLFEQYTDYRNLAETKLATRKMTADILRDEIKALYSGKIDSAVDKATLATLKAIKTSAEAGLEAAQTALTAAQNDESAAQKAKLDARVEAYRDSIAKIAVDIKLKENERTNEQAKLDKLTGTAPLRTKYEALTADIKRDSTLYNNGKKSVKTDSTTLADYDAELGKLKDAVAAATANVKSAGVPHATALAKQKMYNDLYGIINGRDAVAAVVAVTAVPADPTATPPVEAVAAVAAVAAVEADPGLLQKLKDTAKALSDHVKKRKNIDLKIKAASDTRRVHDSLKEIFDADPAGPSIFPGPDGMLGNHDDDDGVGDANTTKTFRQIISVATLTEFVTNTVTNNGVTTTTRDRVTKTTPIFGATQYFTVASIPPKKAAVAAVAAVGTTPAVLAVAAVPAEILVLNYDSEKEMFTNIVPDSVGKYVDVEADDKEATAEQKNLFLFNDAVTKLEEALKALKAAEESVSVANYTEILTRLKSSLAELDALVINNGTDLANAEIAYINALKAIGIKVKEGVTKDAVLATTKKAIGDKKTAAVNSANGKKTDAANKVDSFQNRTREKIELDIKLKGIDIAAAAARIAGNTAKLTALEEEIESASNVEGVSELTASINAIEAEIADLEASKASMVLLKSQYNAVSILITIGLDALELKVKTATAAVLSATGLVIAKEKVISNAWFDTAARIKLIEVLKLELAAMDAEIWELIGIANKYKALAEAALAEATKA